MRQDRHMDEHLVVEELVALGGLNDAVEGQHAAEGAVLEDHQLLVLGLVLTEHPVHPQEDAEIAARGVDLFHPFGHGASLCNAYLALRRAQGEADSKRIKKDRKSTRLNSS